MQGTSARAARGGRSFAGKLGIAIPANLVLFWLVLGDLTFEVALFGLLGGLAGAFLLTRLEWLTHSGMQATPADAAATWRRTEEAGVLTGHAGHA
jgi:hypothetical protein